MNAHDEHVKFVHRLVGGCNSPAGSFVKDFGRCPVNKLLSKNRQQGGQPQACFKPVAERKALQCAKVRELRDALHSAGYRTLDAQAEALGLSRSTAWTVMKPNHKSSGLSAGIINRMLAAPQLPASVRARILEYVRHKAAGLYGHNQKQQRQFLSRLSGEAAAMTISGAIITLQPDNQSREDRRAIDRLAPNFK